MDDALRGSTALGRDRLGHDGGSDRLGDGNRDVEREAWRDGVSNLPVLRAVGAVPAHSSRKALKLSGLLDRDASQAARHARDWRTAPAKPIVVAHDPRLIACVN